MQIAKVHPYPKSVSKSWVLTNSIYKTVLFRVHSISNKRIKTFKMTAHKSAHLSNRGFNYQLRNNIWLLTQQTYWIVKSKEALPVILSVVYSQLPLKVKNKMKNITTF